MTSPAQKKHHDRAERLAEIEAEPGPVAPLDSRATDRQRAFVHYLTTSARSAADAARLAGYSSPGTEARRLILSPHIRAAVRAARLSFIQTDLASLALDTIRDLMTNASTPAPVKLGAARFSLEMAGFGPEAGKAAGQDTGQKELSQMTIAELEALISAREAELPQADARPLPA